MKLEINRSQYNINPVQFLRQNGWATIYDRRRNKTSYVKRLTRDFYPRLHLYLDEYPEKHVFNIHLDQKQASYHGHTAHSADYEDNPVLEQEIARLRQELGEFKTVPKEPKKDILENVGNGILGAEAQSSKKSWWRKIF